MTPCYDTESEDKVRGKVLLQLLPRLRKGCDGGDDDAPGGADDVDDVGDEDGDVSPQTLLHRPCFGGS